MEFTLYIRSKKVKHTIGYILSKYACTRLSRTKVQQVNKAKPMSKTNLNKTHMLKDLSHFKEFKTNIKIWDSQLPTRTRFQQINQALHTFYDGTKYQKEKICLPKPNTWYRWTLSESVLINITEFPQD